MDNAFHDFIIICVLVVFLVEKKRVLARLSKLNLASEEESPQVWQALKQMSLVSYLINSPDSG